MLERVLVWVVRAVSLFQLHKDDFAKVLDLVREAEEKFESGVDKSEYVKTQAKQALRISAPYLVDLVVGLAVGYLGKKGDIKLGTME